MDNRCCLSMSGAVPLLSFIVTLALLLGACSDFPKDARNTLNDIRRDGVMRVGLIENPPWVIAADTGPSGVEPEIVRQLASRLDVDVHWHWGSTGELARALEQYQVDFVVGGLVAGPELPKTVAATKPYYVTRYIVGFPTVPDPMPSELSGLAIALPVISPLHKVLQDVDADVHATDYPEQTGLPVAGPAWRLKALGYVPGRWQLLTEKHLMLVTKGENAWITLLQRHLNHLSGLEQQLQQAEALP